MGLFGGLFKGKETLRAEAEGMGMTLTEVERLLPTVGGSVLDSLEKGTCMRYALRRPQSAGTKWVLLMRVPSMGAQLPNGFLVESDNITPALLDALRPIAEEFGEGFYEFEGVPGEVALFWDEDGLSKGELERIYKALVSIQEA